MSAKDEKAAPKGDDAEHKLMHSKPISSEAEEILVWLEGCAPDAPEAKEIATKKLVAKRKNDDVISISDLVRQLRNGSNGHAASGQLFDERIAVRTFVILVAKGYTVEYKRELSFSCVSFNVYHEGFDPTTVGAGKGSFFKAGQTEL